ncbi:MAG: HAMP domain-containing sensor histidine kinase [Planctomycetota bacterium]
MLSHWPIRTKLKLGLGLLLMTVLALFATAYYGLYAYRGLVKGLSARSSELPLAAQVGQDLVELRDVLIEANERVELASKVCEQDEDHENAEQYFSTWETALLEKEYFIHLGAFKDALDRYRRQLDLSREADSLGLSDDSRERKTLQQIDAVLEPILEAELPEDWLLDEKLVRDLKSQVELLRQLVVELPSHLHTQFQEFADTVRAQYRTAIVAAWVNAALALILLVTSTRLFYKWFAEPLQILVQGSREVAKGKYSHRIQLDTQDEIGELADAMNDMTAQFQETRDDLDRQVRERTLQVVRSEQLASVGFLAAGVSHEINNPLASIALCSESLESRFNEFFADVESNSEDSQVIHDYLAMIQREAFRCKQITEKLLDFARMGDSQRHSTELRDLVEGVIEMVQHLGKYQDKNLELLPGDPVIVEVNAQEIKQVVLNLITNGLESLDPGGTVKVSINQGRDQARITVQDDGCGMTEEVRKHLFEPFFTRRHSGQGTGLGLSITYRIVQEHHGQIDVTSDGVGCGSRFVVSLPAHPMSKEKHHRYQAA